MRDKFIITITDVHGTRQYTLNQIIKKIILWVIILIVIGLTLALLLSHYLIQDVEKLKTETQVLEQKAAKLQKKNEELNARKEKLDRFVKRLLLLQNTLIEKNEKLQNHIQEQQEKLTSLNEKLKEVEKILGIEEETQESNTTLHAQTERMEKIEQESLVYLKNVQKLTKYEKRLLHRTIPIGLPVRYRRISANFGYRIHPIYHKKMFHFGLDLSAPIGRTVYAPADGVVYFRGRKNGYGKFLLIMHPFGFSTAYGHLSAFLVKSGEFVKQGQPIARVGNTGRSTGPHLHYEVRYLSYWLDPKKFIFWDRKNDFASMKNVRKVDWNGLLKVLRKRYLSVQVVKGK